MQSNINQNLNQMKDLKSTLSTICGVVSVIASSILMLPQQGIETSTWLKSVAGGALAISIGIIGYLTGKNPDASAKTPAQLDQIAQEKKI